MHWAPYSGVNEDIQSMLKLKKQTQTDLGNDLNSALKLGSSKKYKNNIQNVKSTL
jgi:hypothetical protein